MRQMHLWYEFEYTTQSALQEILCSLSAYQNFICDIFIYSFQYTYNCEVPILPINLSTYIIHWRLTTVTAPSVFKNMFMYHIVFSYIYKDLF